MGGYELTAAQLVAWHERSTPGEPRVVGSHWRSHPPSDRMSFCYYDGTFSVRAVQLDRILVIVDSKGEASLLSAGPSATMPLEDPTK
jgi:hypothetical protein